MLDMKRYMYLLFYDVFRCKIYKYDGILGVNAVKLKVYRRYKNDISYHFYAYHCVIFMGEF